MIQGERIYKNGYQVMLFPYDHVTLTQAYGAGTYSHCCNTATDWAQNVQQFPFWAPCDCYQLYSGSGADNVTAYRSAHEVLTPSGVKYVSFLFMHDEDPPVFTGLIRQGNLIGHSGTAGIGTGDHSHLDQATGQSATLIDSGYSCSIGVINCFYLQNMLPPEQCYYLSGNETVSTGSLNFQTISGGSTGGGFKWWMAAKMIKEQRNV